MDAERERESRELAEALSRSNRHRRIARVLHELLYEIDLLREEAAAPISVGEASEIISAYLLSGALESHAVRGAL